MSQVLTLFTTPVIYLAFDRLASRVRGLRPDEAHGDPIADSAHMNISAPFIHRPVATTLLTIGVALCGAVAFMLLPVAPLPRIDVPAIFVSAQLARREPRGHGEHGRHTARAASRRHRRRR